MILGFKDRDKKCVFAYNGDWRAGQTKPGRQPHLGRNLSNKMILAYIYPRRYSLILMDLNGLDWTAICLCRSLMDMRVGA